MFAKPQTLESLYVWKTSFLGCSIQTSLICCKLKRPQGLPTSVAFKNWRGPTVDFSHKHDLSHNHDSQHLDWVWHLDTSPTYFKTALQEYGWKWWHHVRGEHISELGVHRKTFWIPFPKRLQSKLAVVIHSNLSTLRPVLGLLSHTSHWRLHSPKWCS